MQKRKNNPAKARKKSSSRRNPDGITLAWGGASAVPLKFDQSSNGRRRTQPRRRNPETDEERQKRLASREKRTVQAFREAYESHHNGRRKAS